MRFKVQRSPFKVEAKRFRVQRFTVQRLKDEFNDTYEQAARTRAAIYGFINYLRRYKAG
jgi:hypothetical protein